jgi:DNA repair protein RAD16
MIPWDHHLTFFILFFQCCTQYLESFVEEGALQMRTPNCPRCFAILTVDLSQPTIELDHGDEQAVHAKYSKNSIINRINMDKWRSSTKIEALVEELTKLQREDRSIKSIVFSQVSNKTALGLICIPYTFGF